MLVSILGSIMALLVLVPVAILSWWAMLKYLDKSTGKSFREDILPVILSDPVAAGRYYGNRTIGVALIVLGPFLKIL